MYVCICNGLTDSDVRRALRGGACSVTEVHRSNRTAPMCGKCTIRIREILAKETGPGFAGAAADVAAGNPLPRMAGG